MNRFLLAILLCGPAWASSGVLVGTPLMEIQTTTLSSYTVIGKGNLLVVNFTSLSTDDFSVTSDTGGNTWSCGTTQKGNSWAENNCFALTKGTGATVITIFSPMATGVFATVMEFTNPSATPLSTTSFNSGATGAMTTGAFTPSAPALIIACGGNLEGTGITVGAGFTIVTSLIYMAAVSALCEYAVTKTGSQNAAMTATTATNWGAQGISFTEMPTTKTTLGVGK